MDRLIRAYKSIDPPTKVQKAVTPKFLKALYNHFVDDNGRNDGNTLNAHLVDIYLGMFFFAGRCCEYAETPEGGRTKRIAMGDITFRDVNMNIMEVNCEEDLNRARYVTLRFRDQKNGDKFDMRTQGRTKRADLDPVLRLGWAVLRIRRRVIGWDDDTDLCTIGTTPNRLRITDKLVLETIREVCRIYGGKKTFGFDPQEIGNKSLRSGAAMALALSRKNHSDMRIMILGRWRSYAFMAYIRPQIIELTSNLAEDMVDSSVTDATNQGEEMRLDF